MPYTHLLCATHFKRRINFPNKQKTDENNIKCRAGCAAPFVKTEPGQVASTAIRRTVVRGTGVSRHHWDLIDGPTETVRKLQHYIIEWFERASELVPYYVERCLPVEQRRGIFPVWIQVIVPKPNKTSSTLDSLMRLMSIRCLLYQGYNAPKLCCWSMDGCAQKHVAQRVDIWWVLELVVPAINVFMAGPDEITRSSLRTNKLKPDEENLVFINNG